MLRVSRVSLRTIALATVPGGERSVLLHLADGEASMSRLRAALGMTKG